MGWSCRADAGDTERRISAACVAQTGSQNVFYNKGEKFFYEVSRTEYDDGRITGAIFRFDGRRAGGFTISPDGDVTRGPAPFRKLAVAS